MWFRLCAVCLSCAMLTACSRPAQVLTLATTTSVGNSGLLEVLLPAYDRGARVVVRTHLVGSGRALAMLAGGQADAVMTHAPAAEAAALEEHPAWRYTKFMFNDFVIVGPESDPARVRGSATAAEAAGRIAASGSRFISRGDQSGTHEREQALWKAAGTIPGGNRLVVAGAGMGATLRIAGETGSYTLTDRATWLQQPGVSAIVYENDPSLVNTYAIVFDPAGPLGRDAQLFTDWLTDGAGRTLVDGYRSGSGVRAYQIWPANRPRNRPGDLPR